MKSVVPGLVLCFLVLAPAVDGLAAGQSVFAFRASDGWLIEIIPPDNQSGSSATINKSFIGDVWSPWASATDDSGRILSLTVDPPQVRLVAFSPFSGTAEEICVFNQPFMDTNDLTFGPSGVLLWAKSGPTGTTLHAVDTDNCGLTEWGSFPVNHLRTIEYHQGAFYCTGGGAAIYRVDPSTFHVTTVMPANYYCGIFGLSSDGDNLFFGLSCGYGANSPTYTDIGAIDPQTGEVLWSVFVPNDEYWEGYSMIEVVDQPIRPIPAVNTAGGSVLAVLVGLVGMLLARRI